MVFVKFNYLNGASFAFALDFLITLESAGDNHEHTRVFLTNERNEILPIDIEEFVAKVYSDRPYKEYELIEIDQPKPAKERPEPAAHRPIDKG